MDLLRILDGTPEPPIIELFLTQHDSSGDYCLPTPMSDFQKELTDQIISLHYSDILKYFETSTRNDLLTNSLETCYLNTQLVSSHPYLLIDHYMPKSLVLRDIPGKLAETSGKFQVLKNLMELLNQIGPSSYSNTVNVVVLIRHSKKDRALDLVEALLWGCKCNIVRYRGNYIKDPSKSKKHKVTVHLLTNDIENNEVEVPSEWSRDIRFDLVISFDISINTDSSFITQIRMQSQRNSESIAPIIRLVPINTIEHCALFFRKIHPQGSEQYLYDVTAAIVCLRERVGILPPDLRPIFNQNLTYLSGYFKKLINRDVSGTSRPPWPLPEMPCIPNYTPMDVEQSLLTEVHYYYDEDAAARPPKRPTYYELNRLNKNYLTNPLRKDNAQLTGISSVTGESYSTILTHRLVAKLNTVYLEWQRIKAEYATFLTLQNRISAEEEAEEVKKKLTESIESIQRRIVSANERSELKTQGIELMKAEISQFEEDLKKYSDNSEPTINHEKKDLQKWYKNQLEIFQLEDQADSETAKLAAKQSEMTYMAKEVTTATESIANSQLKLVEVQQEKEELKQKLDALFADIDLQGFESEKTELMCQIDRIRERNKELNNNLNGYFKILSDTREGRQGRKSRGLSPNVK